MKHILFLAINMGGGGAEKVLVNLINALDHKKYQISLLTYTLDNARNNEIKNKVDFINIMNGNNLFCGKKVQKKQALFSAVLLKSFSGIFLNSISNIYGYEVKFAFLDSYRTTKFMPCQEDGNVTILRIASDYTMPSSGFMTWKRTELPIQFKMHTDIYPTMTHVVAGSQGAADAFLEATGLTSTVTIINNMFDIRAIQAAANEPIEIIKQKFVIGTVGRFHPIKGHMRLIEVCNKLNHDGFDFELWLIGTGDDELALKEKVAEYNMSNVYFWGYQENPHKYMKQFDLYVNPAFSEGFPNAVSEAVILGLPCVVADHAGEKEIFGQHNEYGLVVENSTEGLYDGVRQLLSNRALYEHYKTTVLQRQEFFKKERVLAQYEQLFGEGAIV